MAGSVIGWIIRLRVVRATWLWLKNGGIRVEGSQKRLRGLVGGEVVFDTTRPVLVWEVPYYPTYYIREEDVAVGLAPNGKSEDSPSRGEAEGLDLKINGSTVANGAQRYPESPIEELRGLVRFDWDSLDQWLEEDEPIYTHARDPHTRLDILHSSRHVEVVIDGEKVAESSNPTILFETGLPPRFYIPIADVRTSLLKPSKTETHCPYKGTASHWSVVVEDKVHNDLVWTYRNPLPESQKIAGLLAFYNEKVDLYVDGELQESPKTKFS
jgi:uncharacterized protein (DUF427 family)